MESGCNRCGCGCLPVLARAQREVAICGAVRDSNSFASGLASSPAMRLLVGGFARLFCTKFDIVNARAAGLPATASKDSGLAVMALMVPPAAQSKGLVCDKLPIPSTA